MLLGVLAIPFGEIRARRDPLVPAALGAYTALLVHFTYDWDWELPAVTLAGLFCGLAALVAARDGSRTVILGTRSRTALLGAIGVCASSASVAVIATRAQARTRLEVSGEGCEQRAARRRGHLGRGGGLKPGADPAESSMVAAGGQAGKGRLPRPVRIPEGRLEKPARPGEGEEHAELSAREVEILALMAQGAVHP